MSANARAPDVAIVGGGIVGCALAAFLAEDGARVRLYERDELAAGASGRNSGLLQHPMDAALVDVYTASEAHYRELGHGFELPSEPAGVLVVGEDPAALEPVRTEVAAAFPELGAEALDPGALRALEPELAEGLSAYRLATGSSVPPAAGRRRRAAAHEPAPPRRRGGRRRDADEPRRRARRALQPRDARRQLGAAIAPELAAARFAQSADS